MPTKSVTRRAWYYPASSVGDLLILSATTGYRATTVLQYKYLSVVNFRTESRSLYAMQFSEESEMNANQPRNKTVRNVGKIC